MSTLQQIVNTTLDKAKRFVDTEIAKRAAFFAATGTAAYGATTYIATSAAEKTHTVYYASATGRTLQGAEAGEYSFGQFAATAGFIWAVLAAGMALYFKTRPPKEQEARPPQSAT